MKKWRGILGACAMLIGGMAGAQVQDMPGGPKVNQLNLHEGVTQIARDVMWLHWMLLTICIVIFIGVFGVMFYSIWAHRKSRSHKAATFHEHLGVEVAWTVIPFIIVIAMALPATKTVVAMKDTSSADLTVKVTGYQWKWGYEYLDGSAAGVKFLSTLSTPRAQIENREPKGQFYLMEVDNHMVVPVDKKVRVVLTAADVIHSWMIPDFGVKQDAIPGFLRDAWFRAEQPGIYRGQCAELCGKDHAFMPIVVEVLAQADYDKWVEDQKRGWRPRPTIPTRSGRKPNWLPVAKGFRRQLRGLSPGQRQGHPAASRARRNKVVLGPKAAQINTVLKGKPGTAMAAFGGQLNDVEIAAVISYTRHAWSNAGKGQDPTVQPKDVTAGR